MSLWQKFINWLIMAPPGKPVDMTVCHPLPNQKKPVDEITSMQEVGPRTIIPQVAAMPKQMPECGIELIKSFEGCKLRAYRDQRGILSIGYGHTEGVKEGDTCTQAQADAWLKIDLVWAWQAVLKHVKVNLTPNEAGALLSFVYNAGETEFARSDVLKYVNSASNAYVPQALKEVCKIKVGNDYKISFGLLRRRCAEAALFTGSDWRTIIK